VITITNQAKKQATDLEFIIAFEDTSGTSSFLYRKTISEHFGPIQHEKLRTTFDFASIPSAYKQASAQNLTQAYFNIYQELFMESRKAENNLANVFQSQNQSYSPQDDSTKFTSNTYDDMSRSTMNNLPSPCLSSQSQSTQSPAFKELNHNAENISLEAYSTQISNPVSPQTYRENMIAQNGHNLNSLVNKEYPQNFPLRTVQNFQLEQMLPKINSFIPRNYIAGPLPKFERISDYGDILRSMSQGPPQQNTNFNPNFSLLNSTNFLKSNSFWRINEKE